MDLEKLEDSLRDEKLSEKEIVQILAFICTLQEHLPIEIKEVRGYFIKFLSFRAVSYLKAISPEPVDYQSTYENMVSTISEDLIGKFACKEINRTQILEQALERVKKEIGGLRQKVIDTGLIALEKVLKNTQLDEMTILEISKQFKIQILAELT
jgi:hypothetical protein